MTAFTKEEAMEWRQHPITEELLSYLVERLDTEVTGLSTGAGLDALADRRRVGMIEAFRDVVDWKPEIQVEEEEPND